MHNTNAQLPTLADLAALPRLGGVRVDGMTVEGMPGRPSYKIVARDGGRDDRGTTGSYHGVTVLYTVDGQAWSFYDAPPEVLVERKKVFTRLADGKSAKIPFSVVHQAKLVELILVGGYTDEVIGEYLGRVGLGTLLGLHQLNLSTRR